MRLSDLNKVLEGALSPEDFESLIKQELDEHIESSKKKGASAPIYLTADLSLIINRFDAEKLEKFYSDGRISTPAIVYIADALSLSEAVKFENKEVEDKVQSLSFE